MDENIFWPFMVQRYARQGVEPCCLSLQNHYRANVVFLLWLCWLDSQNVPLDNDLFVRAKGYAESFEQGYTSVLRTLRRDLKADHSIVSSAQLGLRKSVLAVELSFERVLADYLFELSLSCDTPESHVSTSLSAVGWLYRYLDELTVLDCQSFIERLNPV